MKSSIGRSRNVLRSMLRWLLVAVPLFASLSPALARLAQVDSLAIERVDDIRNKLLEVDRLLGNPRSDQQAQWYNFPNWPNWPNWGNWRNSWLNY